MIKTDSGTLNFFCLILNNRNNSYLASPSIAEDHRRDVKAFILKRKGINKYKLQLEQILFP